MLNNKFLLKVYSVLLIICIIVLISLALLGGKTRIGYLSEFNLQSSENGEYNYNFRIKYYSKVFRNSDIYGVYLDTNKIIQSNNFIKNIKINEQGSPFGILVSTKKLEYEEKIDNINYTLRIQTIFYVILSVLILLDIYLYIKYKNENYKNLVLNKILENRKKVFKIYIIIFLFSLVVAFIFYLLGNISHKGYLSDFELMAESKAGFIYKAKFEPKSLFKIDTNKALLIKNKPDYVKNYGFSIEINRMPDWYNTTPQEGLTASAWNNDDGTFTVSNSISWNSYNYIVPLSVGEKYRTSIEVKRLSDYSEGQISYYLDQPNYNIIIPNTENITDDYKVYAGDIEIKEAFSNAYPHLYFSYPKGVFSVKSIKVEQISDNLYIKNGNEIIVTTTKNIDNNPYIGDIRYYTSINYNIVFKVIIILVSIYLFLLILLFRKEIIEYIVKAKIIFTENKKLIFKIYGIVIISLVIIIAIFYLLGNMSHKGYLSDFELITSTKAGYVYKAKLISKGLFSPNFLYKYSDKPLKLENKPDYVKNYGYSIEINRMPDWYNTSPQEGLTASAWNNEDGTFTVSNSISWNSYNYIVPLSVGELYSIDILTKGTNTNNIRLYMDFINDSVHIPMINSSNNYLHFYREILIYQVRTNIYPNLSFNFTEDVMTFSHIKISKKNENFNLYNNNEVILTSSSVLDSNIKLDGIIYKLSLSKILKLILSSFFVLNISVYVLYNLFISDFYIFTNKYSFEQVNMKYIYFISAVYLILFVFQFWLVFPGYFQDMDNLVMMSNAKFSNLSNWHPILTEFILNKLFNIFGENAYYLTFIQLFSWYIGLFILTIALYVRFKNKMVLLICLLSYFSPIFNANNYQIKDYTSSNYLFVAFSLIIFQMLIFIKRKNFNYVLKILTIIFILLSLLSRHAMIVTIYPIFTLFAYLILKKYSFKNIFHYCISFIGIMFVFAVFLVSIHKYTPYIIEYNIPNTFLPKDAPNNVFFKQIAACAVPNNDDSMIPKEWYEGGKSFNDMKKLYNNNKFYGDQYVNWWAEDRVFRHNKLDGISKVWIKYIIKYPLDYLKYNIAYLKKFLFDTYTAIRSYDDFISNYNDNLKYHKHFEKYANTNSNIIKRSFYNILYSIPYTHKYLYYVVIDIVIFIISVYLSIRYINKNGFEIMLLSLMLSFSGIATFILMSFTSTNYNRYIYPIVPVTIMSLITLLIFIYDKGGLKKFIEELKGKR